LSEKIGFVGDLELKSFLNEAISSLAKDALRLVARRPRLIMEFKRLSSGLDAQEAKRKIAASDGVNVPPFMIASITKRCNLGCAGCYAAINTKGCLDEMDSDVWAGLFCEAEELGVSFILLAGGEPLERMEVLEEAMKHRSIIFPVFTNGCKLDREKALRFAKHRNMVPIISIEGGRKLTDDRRGDGIYDRIIDAMGILVKEAVFFGVSITVTKENIQEVCSDEFIKNLRSRGAGVFIYVEYVPADGVSMDLAPETAERQYLEQRTAVLRKKQGGIHICFPGDEDAMGGCLAAGRGFVHINPAGGIEPCPFSPSSDRNVSEYSLKDALNSPFLAQLRASGAMELEHLGGCALWNKRKEVEALLGKP
jgi:MoaA/NifB/PqqE/SkfB family radical SAM enzyme